MATKQEIHVRNTLIPKKKLDEFADAVCFIEKKESDGSGFYAKVQIKGEDVFGVFTCNHVLKEEREAKDVKVVFRYDEPNTGKRVKLRPDLLFKTNDVSCKPTKTVIKDLDYSFVGVDKDEVDALNIIPIEFLKEPEVLKDDAVYIFQHPDSRPKELGGQSSIKYFEPPFIYYEVDTEPGSSGSPVFLKKSLIAVHHGGNEELKCNRGTLCSEILSHLNTGKYTKPNDDQPSEKETVDRGITWKEGEPTDDDLHNMAEHVTGCWEHLASKLGVKRNKVNMIDDDNVKYGTIQKKARAMLDVWQGSKENKTYEKLGNALIELDKFRLAQELCGQKPR